MRFPSKLAYTAFALAILAAANTFWFSGPLWLTVFTAVCAGTCGALALLCEMVEKTPPTP